MNEEWWERPTCFVCNYWWALLLVMVLALAAYLTRHVWLPILGFEPQSQPVELGTGDIQVTLTWGSTNDLDLWVIDPAGEAIYYRHPNALSNGLLDVDANADCSDVTQSPVENIYWPLGEAPAGEYRVEIHYYKKCETPSSTDYQLRLLVDGEVSNYRGVLNTQGEINSIPTFSR